MKILIGFVLCLFASVKCELFSDCDGKPSRTYVANSQNNDNCRSFIYCNGEESFEDSCPEGLAFNPIELTCDSAENIECEYREEDNDYESNEIEKVSTTKSPLVSTKKPIVTASTKKHPTPPGRPLKTSPTKSTTLKKNSNRPIPTRTSSPTRKSPPTLSTRRSTSKATRPTTSSPTRVTSTTDNGAPVRIPTPPGGHNVPGQHNEPVSTMPPIKEDRETTRLPTERTTGVTSRTKQSSQLPTSTINEWDSMEGSNESGEKETEADANIREQCTKKSVGSFAYPEDCNFYYRCIRGVLHKQECPRGFGWDAKSKMCTSKGCTKLNEE